MKHNIWIFISIYYVKGDVEMFHERLLKCDN